MMQLYNNVARLRHFRGSIGMVLSLNRFAHVHRFAEQFHCLIELPAIAVDVPAGENLYLTVAPIADMYAGQRGPLPGVMMLKGGTLALHSLR